MTRTRIRCCLLAGAFAAALAAAASRASDHADPMSLNVFAIQANPEANLTDLHAYVVDKSGQPLPALDAAGDAIARVDPFVGEHRLIVSLCVRRALRPEQAGTLDLAPYRFRIHIDVAPPVRFADRGAEAGAPLADVHRDRSMQALYGGIITHPEDIVSTRVLEFALSLRPEGEPTVELASTPLASGFLGPGTNIKALEGTAQPVGDAIEVTAGLFDDPFIFPRFFRTNVVGVVASIPISTLMTPPPAPDPPKPPPAVPIVLWATTHRDGEPVDHVGRSLRTQLPRFGHLNGVRPADHVKAIQRVHDAPSVMEALLGRIVAPLFAHRHYDTVPDVVIYDLRRPARYPNGRWLEDDVAKTLADAGETLLLELSYAESREFERATRNDKPFRTSTYSEPLATNPQEPFPYFAAPWTKDEVKKRAEPDGEVPRAPDADAIAHPHLDDSIWRKVFGAIAASVAVLTALLFFTVRSWGWRFALVVAALIGLALLSPLRAQNLLRTQSGFAQQADGKARLLGVGVGSTVLLLLGALYARGYRRGRGSRAPERRFPRGQQGWIEDDSRIRSYGEIHRALFDPRECRPYYRRWGDPAEAALPFYATTLASITEGVFGLREQQFAMERAAARTLRSRGDLRWGPDGNGFRRLVHPMGVCLAGTWEIHSAPPETRYTGYFAPGKRGRVIARYSVGGNHPVGGHYRSLGLVGKLFPPEDAPIGDTQRAHFITQEDLGGAFTRSIKEAVLTNSPPVTLLNRGMGLFAFIPVIVALLRADTQPAERQLYEIAELEKPEGAATWCPRFMRLTISDPEREIGGDRADFRDQILRAIQGLGVPGKKRKLVFTIEVSDEGWRTLFQRVVGQKWTPIGNLTFDQAMASYNGDFVVHFHHPVWRRDRNDSNSVARRNLRSS